MRVLLVQPRLDARVRSLGRLEPLSLEILAAAIPDHDVRIFDYRFEPSLTDTLRTWRPDVVGVTALTVEYAHAMGAIEEVRAFSKRIRIVVGGTHATMVPEDFNRPDIAAIVVGLGHDTFRDLLAAYEAGTDPGAIRGLALPTEGVLRLTPACLPEDSFDHIPKPNRELTRRYRRQYRAALSFDPEGESVSITSLGCPGRCNFCTSWQQNAGRYLERSAESAVEDILSIHGTRIMLADDNSLHNVERAWQIVELLRRAKTRKRIRTYARADTIARHPDLMKALREVGVHALIVGYEAVTDERLRSYHKGNTVEINRAAIRVLREAGIENRAMFVVAQDFTRENFDEVFRFIDAEGIRTPLFTVFTPVPGTDVYRDNAANLLTHDHVYFDYTHCVLPTTLDYLEFMREYVRLFHRAYAFRRYMRDWVCEWRETLTTGRRPVTERQHISLLRAILQTLLFHRFMRPVYRDYAAIAAAAGPRVRRIETAATQAPPL
jgi:radical SAM superfamily enzyme YgiQ (UPF0313 family)